MKEAFVELLERNHGTDLVKYHLTSWTLPEDSSLLYSQTFAPQFQLQYPSRYPFCYRNL